MTGAASGREPVRAVIFDLDGVIVSTDDLHSQAWRELADDLGIPFPRELADSLRGISRMDSLDRLLGPRRDEFSAGQRAAFAARKDARYRELLSRLSPADIAPGALRLLSELRAAGVPVAIASSSRNALTILGRIGLADAFDAVTDGTRIAHSKPDPEVFLLAAAGLSVRPSGCLVVEDADAGVEGAHAAGMRVMGVGPASSRLDIDLRAPDLSSVHATDLLSA